MKTAFRQLSVAPALLLALSILDCQLSTAFCQGTAFTYQGQLQNNGSPANGSYNLTFSVFNTNTSGVAIAGPVTNNDVGVSNGLFTVRIDFGPGVFTGEAEWLEIGVETNGGSAFTPLTPRQELTPTPYALFADTSSNLTGAVHSGNLLGTYSNALVLNNPGNSFSGTFSGNGGGVTNVNAATLGGLGAANLWHTAGNAGTTAGTNYVGTSDNQPLEIHANGQRALRLEPDTTGSGAPNVIGGSPVNFMDTGGVIGGFIGGGGAISFNGVAYTNRVSAYFASVVGGYGNWIQGYGNNAFIGGGIQNTVEGAAGLSVIGGGQNNVIGTNAYVSVIGGGYQNSMLSNAQYATIGGGLFNQAGDVGSFVGGGYFNVSQSNSSYSTIGGGQNNAIPSGANHAFIGGGGNNSAGNQFATVGGGAFNNASGFGSIVGGGYGNAASYVYSTVSGGYHVAATGYAATVCGGYACVSAGYYSIVSGGQDNTNGAYANYASIGGGFDNSSLSDGGAISGGGSNSIGDYAGYSVIAGGYGNDIGGLPNGGQYEAAHSAIVGGDDNIIEGTYDFIGCGNSNIAAGASSYSVIGGGVGNGTYGPYSAIGGGYANIVGGLEGYATIGGGYQNNASGIYSTIGGGSGNSAGGSYTTVSGGFFNNASGTGATVAGGIGNVASGPSAFAAGSDAQALHSGTFVWADSSQVTDFTSTGTNQFLVRAAGGVGINTTSPEQDLSVNGGINLDQGNNNSGGPFNNSTPAGTGLTFGSGSGEGIASQRTGGANQYDLVFYTGFGNRMTILNNGNVGIGNSLPGTLLVVGNSGTPAYCDGTTWVNGSDRNAKEHFAPIRPTEILDKVTAMPITEWNFKTDAAKRHLGPMAQDFYAAFGLNGVDDKHIADVDEGGVALAAIQGLNQKLEAEAKEKDAEIEKLKAKAEKVDSLERQNDSLAARLNELEATVKLLVARK